MELITGYKYSQYIMSLLVQHMFFCLMSVRMHSHQTMDM